MSSAFAEVEEVFRDWLDQTARGAAAGKMKKAELADALADVAWYVGVLFPRRDPGLPGPADKRQAVVEAAVGALEQMLDSVLDQRETSPYWPYRDGLVERARRVLDAIDAGTITI